MPGDLKIAFDFWDSDHTISLCVVEEGVDWHSEVLRDLDLPQVLERIPAFVEEARAKWATDPKYQVYKKPRAPRKSKETTAAAPAATVEESPPAPEDTDQPAPPPEGTEAPEAGGLPLLTSETADAPLDPEATHFVYTLPEEGVTQVATPIPEAEPPPAAQNGGEGKWVYKVYRKDGEVLFLSGGQEPPQEGWTSSSYSNTHDALRDLGVTQEEIDKHKYWHRHDRLPSSHRRRIGKVSAP